MQVRLLGPVELDVAGQPVPIRAAKQRAVLAMLALRANETVAADRLMEGLWGEHPPASAPKLIQQHVSQLRRAIAAGDGGGAGAEIVTRGRGYELRIATGRIDVGRFQRLVAEEPALALRAICASEAASMSDTCVSFPSGRERDYGKYARLSEAMRDSERSR